MIYKLKKFIYKKKEYSWLFSKSWLQENIIKRRFSPHISLFIYWYTKEICKLNSSYKRNGMRESRNQVSVIFVLSPQCHFRVSKSGKHHLIIYFNEQISQYELYFASEKFNHMFIICQLTNFVSLVKIFSKYHLEKGKIERKNKQATIYNGLLHLLARTRQLFSYFGAKLWLVFI